MYSTKDTEEKVFESKFIEPGVHVVKIVGIKGEEPEGYSPRLMFGFTTQDGKAAEAVFYMSEKAVGRSLEKVKHLATKCIKTEDLDKVEAESLEDYASQLNKILKNKVLRVKFTGEEIEGKEGKNNWDKATIGLPPFAEATKEGAEYTPVSEEDSKLTFNRNNKYDYKALPVADFESNGNGTPASEENDEEPF